MKLKTKDLQFSPIKAIQAEAQDRGAISLAQGIPKFSLPLEIKQAAIRAIEEGKVDFYGLPQGIPELRKKISERHLAEEGIFYDPESEVLVTAGALQALTVALLGLLSPGDELIIPVPTYFPFLNLPKALGIKPVFVPLSGREWRLEIADLQRAITPKTAAILLCHPNNPTGTIYSKEELEAILKVAQEHDLLVVTDEVYRFFTYGVPYPSFGQFRKDKLRLVRIMSFSKAYALSGWRVGYLLSPKTLTKEILKVHEMTTTASASLPAQYAALAALTEFPDLPFEFAAILNARKKRMRKRLEKLSSIFEFPEPQGAYYYFVQLKNGVDDVSFAKKLLEKAGVAVVPGSTFGPGGEGYLRLSFAANEWEIEEAFDRMESYLLGRGNKEKLEEMLVGAKGVSEDSRTLAKGEIFVAISGGKFDGHDFAKEALKEGAIWVVGERELSLPRYRRVQNSRKALGLLSAAWYGNPSKKLKVVGVTGTDGKTTTSHLLAHLLNEAGIRTVLLSTLNAPGLHTTTPPSPLIQKILADAVRGKKEAAVVEVTSHGIAQERIAGTSFEATVLTNITPEHLDYHETFGEYRATKAKLLAQGKIAVLNRSDPSFDALASALPKSVKVVSYGLTKEADLWARGIKYLGQSTSFKLVKGKEEIEILLPLPGLYNVQNALAASAAAAALDDSPLRLIKRALEAFDPKILVGRFEKIEEIADFTIVVDFAHTPNALAAVLNHAARVKPAGAKLIVVFGAAGERDRLKRSEMGRVAAKMADLIVLTSEDPRSEKPEEIIDEIAQGCFAEGAVEGKNFIRIPDRRLAIRAVLEKARRGDYVLILGKGHEETMAIGGKEYPWSDQVVVKEEFAQIFR